MSSATLAGNSSILANPLYHRYCGNTLSAGCEYATTGTSKGTLRILRTLYGAYIPMCDEAASLFDQSLSELSPSLQGFNLLLTCAKLSHSVQNVNPKHLKKRCKFSLCKARCTPSSLVGVIPPRRDLAAARQAEVVRVAFCRSAFLAPRPCATPTPPF